MDIKDKQKKLLIEKTIHFLKTERALHKISMENYMNEAYRQKFGDVLNSNRGKYPQTNALILEILNEINYIFPK